MHAYVFTDKALMKQAGQFAWLSIDIDKPKNAAFLEKFPSKGVPTFLLIDPGTETGILSWYGTSSARQLQSLLEDGLKERNEPAMGGADGALARGDRLGVQGKLKEAAAAYREAFDLGGPEWSRFTRAAESMMLAYELSGDSAGGEKAAAKAAMDYAPKLPRNQSFVNVMRVGIKAAGFEKESTVNGQVRNSTDSVQLKRLKALAEEALNVRGGFGDDKAEIYQTLISISRRANDEAGAKEYATRMWAFLEQEAKAAPNAEARASLDSWRMTAARFLNDPERAIPALKASERDLPGDYNPSMRLASVYVQLNRFDDALEAYRRAYAKAYGPRKISILTSSASIYEKKGDKASAKSTLGQALKMAESLPEKQSTYYVKWIKTQMEKYE